MALGAPRAKQASMHFWFPVTGETFRRQSSELATRVTRFAGNLTVASCQDKVTGMLLNRNTRHRVDTIMTC